jgi:DNA replication protein DnaC
MNTHSAISVSSELTRLLKKMGCPENIKPFDRNKIEAEKRQAAEAMAIAHQQRVIEKLMGRSGLNTRFLECSFDNYVVEHAEQGHAVELAKRYVDKFADLLTTGKGFLFLGTPGTGKNHLASAMANALMRRRYSVVLISAMDLFARLRMSYNDKSLSEEKLISEFMRPQLLIIDEIGLQRGSLDELLWLTRIIDKRLYGRRPTGFITNLNRDGLHELLGERAYQRLQDAASVAVPFNWPSYRGKKRGGEHGVN